MVHILFYSTASSWSSHILKFNQNRNALNICALIWLISLELSHVPSVQSMTRKFPGIILLSVTPAFTCNSMLFPCKLVPLQFDTVSALTVPSWEHLWMSFTWNAAGVASDCSWMMFRSWNLLPFSANLDGFLENRQRHRVLESRNTVGEGWWSWQYLPAIPAQMKESEPEHCCCVHHFSGCFHCTPSCTWFVCCTLSTHQEACCFVSWTTWKISVNRCAKFEAEFGT